MAAGARRRRFPFQLVERRGERSRRSRRCSGTTRICTSATTATTSTSPLRWCSGTAPFRQDDCVEVFISPNPDKIRNYYGFEMNVIGTMLNFIRADWYKGPFNSEPEGVRLPHLVSRAAGKQDSPEDDHWILELAIPFKNFAKDAAHTPPQRWRHVAAESESRGRKDERAVQHVVAGVDREAQFPRARIVRLGAFRQSPTAGEMIPDGSAICLLLLRWPLPLLDGCRRGNPRKVRGRAAHADLPRLRMADLRRRQPQLRQSRSAIAKPARALGNRECLCSASAARRCSAKISGSITRRRKCSPAAFSTSSPTPSTKPASKCAIRTACSGEAVHTVKVRTRGEPKAAADGRVLHVYPPAWRGQKQEPAFTGLKQAYFGSGNGDWAVLSERKVRRGRHHSGARRAVQRRPPPILAPARPGLRRNLRSDGEGHSRTSDRDSRSRRRRSDLRRRWRARTVQRDGRRLSHLRRAHDPQRRHRVSGRTEGRDRREGPHGAQLPASRMSASPSTRSIPARRISTSPTT